MEVQSKKYSSDHNAHVWPEEWQQGITKTLNNQGVMTTEHAPATHAFISWAKQAHKPLLDVGCAFGNSSLQALSEGGEIIACDLCEEHLKILETHTPEESRERLRTIAGAFPDDLSFASESLSGVHISMVLHFLRGDTIQMGLKKCHDWTEKGGKLFLANMTPSLGLYSGTGIPEAYEARVARGERWPGEIIQTDYLSGEWKAQLPAFVHLFEMDTIIRVAEEAGFIVEDARYYCHEHIPEIYKTNGKEFVSIVAVKP